MSENCKLTLFRRFNQVAGHRTLEELIRVISGTYFEKEVTRIRQLVEAGQAEKANVLKKQLLAFTPSGFYLGGRTPDYLQRYNPYIILDLDHLDSAQLDRLKTTTRQDPYSIAGFTSPGGRGYKIVIRVDSTPEKHEQTFKQVSAWFEGFHKCTVDQSGKDISRLCFLSHDPEAWLDTQKTIFKLDPSDTALVNNERADSQTGKATAESLLDILAQTQSKAAYQKGNRNNFLYLFANNANRAGISEKETQSFAVRLFADLNAAEIKQTIHSAYQHNREEYAITDAVANPRKHSIERAVGEVPALQNFFDTPTFPDQVFTDLPALLFRGAEVFSQARERDVFLSGALAILSGCLNGISGEYGCHLTFPNLYTFIVAPAASGKSALTFSKKLGEALHQSILDSNKQARRNYQQEQFKYKRQFMKSRIEGGILAQPVRPPMKTLFIPANASSAALIKHLRNSDGIGIMCETEADSINNVLKQDWGGYSDLLRKAFHFEKISYSRKMSEEFYEIDQPRLSVAISGTPDQMCRLIPSVEDGLFSRFLFYGYALEPRWRNVAPSPDNKNLRTHFDGLSKTVLQLARFTARHPTQFSLQTKQWQKLNQYFEKLLLESNDHYGIESTSVVKRLGNILFRIAMTLTACRRFEREDTTDQVYCEEQDFQTALQIVEIYLQHAMCMMAHLPKKPSSTFNRMTSKKHILLEQLPPTFQRKEAIEKGKALGISRSTVDRFLKALSQAGQLSTTEFGHYQKRSP